MIKTDSGRVVRISVVIPAFNEEQSIGKVIGDIPEGLVQEVVVVNNGSTDNTVTVAQSAGATVIDQPQKGYGNACLKGIDYIKNESNLAPPEILVFLDGDYSDFPAEMPQLIEPITRDGFDMVIGSRAMGERESGSMMPQQIFGNWLASWLIRIFYGYTYTDLGPFRAIKWEKLLALKMADQTFGWTVEMQVKAVKQKLKITEVPVSYKKRIGVSKVTGTLYGTFMAGVLIIYTIFKYSFKEEK